MPLGFKEGQNWSCSWHVCCLGMTDNNGRSKCRVVVCDADCISAAHIATLVEEFGATVCQCHTATDCESLISDGAKLLIVAALLPDMDGFALTRRVRKYVDGVVMISALNAPTKAAIAGADHFLLKPVNRSVLAPVLQAFLAEVPV